MGKTGELMRRGDAAAPASGEVGKEVVRPGGWMRN
jgi:hypothetical protein